MHWRIAQFTNGLLAVVTCLGLSAQARLAEGFPRLPPGAKVALMPMDIELYSVTAGGVNQPQAEWTTQARKHLTEAILARNKPGYECFRILPGEPDEALAELRHLNNAVARSILIHHFGHWKLPSKGGRLDWSLGEEAAAIQKAMPADYALFLFLRDSYATAGRKATIAMLAVLRVGVAGGAQVGHASLVDLRTGQVVWFNHMANATGDVREPEPARRTLVDLLQDFPQHAPAE